MTLVGKPSLLLLLGLYIATPIYALGPAFASRKKITPRMLVAAGLGMVAFAIWSISVPANGWQEIKFVKDNPGAFAVVAAAVGLAFGFFAEGAVRRTPSK